MTLVALAGENTSFAVIVGILGLDTTFVACPKVQLRVQPTQRERHLLGC